MTITQKHNVNYIYFVIVISSKWRNNYGITLDKIYLVILINISPEYSLTYLLF
jgi:hypothetical protein